MNYEQGEILLVPFPFTNLSSMKKRPVLLISKNQDNKNQEDIIVCGITSNLKEAKYSVFIDNSDLTKGQIPTKSKIRVDKIFTLENRLIIKSLGKINEIKLKKVKEEFQKLI